MSNERRRTYGSSGEKWQGQFTIAIDQSNPDPAAVTVDNQESANELLSKFRRCLCTLTSDNNVSICYLNDSDSNYYEDGSKADLTGSEGDVMVYFPEFYYKGTSGGGGCYKI